MYNCLALDARHQFELDSAALPCLLQLRFSRQRCDRARVPHFMRFAHNRPEHSFVVVLLYVA